MARTATLTPSCKQCRREGEKLFLKGERCYTSKCAIVKRKYAPGVHGIKQQPRLSEYGNQLRSKQKAKRIYGIMETAFFNYYKKASQQSGDREQTIKKFLEMRLDNVVYRLGLAQSRQQARQLVSYGHIRVSGKKLDIPSYQVRVGDQITVKEKSLQTPLFRDLSKKLEQHQLPSWLLLDAKALQGKVLSSPTPQDLQGTIDAKLIVEYYSRF